MEDSRGPVSERRLVASHCGQAVPSIASGVVVLVNPASVWCSVEPSAAGAVAIRTGSRRLLGPLEVSLDEPLDASVGDTVEFRLRQLVIEGANTRTLVELPSPADPALTAAVLAPATARHRAAMLRAEATTELAAVDAEITTRLGSLGSALNSTDDLELERAVHDLVGYGQELLPCGDVAVIGVLCALQSVTTAGHLVGRLATVLGSASHSTTLIGEAMLRLACSGCTTGPIAEVLALDAPANSLAEAISGFLRFGPFPRPEAMLGLVVGLEVAAKNHH